MKKTQKNYNRNRIAIYRSNQHIYAQIIDDAKGETLVSASDHETGLKETKKKTKTKEKKDTKASEQSETQKIEKARAVGKLLAEKAIDKKIKKVFFDRRNYKYHGRVKALADGARSAGLDF